MKAPGIPHIILCTPLGRISTHDNVFLGHIWRRGSNSQFPDWCEQRKKTSSHSKIETAETSFEGSRLQGKVVPSIMKLLSREKRQGCRAEEQVLYPISLVFVLNSGGIISLHTVLVICSISQGQAVPSLVQKRNDLILESLTHTQHQLGVLGDVIHCDMHNRHQLTHSPCTQVSSLTGNITEPHFFELAFILFSFQKLQNRVRNCG